MSLKSIGQQEKIKLDAYDKKLLFCLMQNSRMRRNALAKTLRLSPQRVNYKIQRLEQEIIQPTVIINYPLLHIPFYILLAQDIVENDKQKLLNSPELFFLMQVIGRYQYVIAIITTDLQSFVEKYMGTVVFEVHQITSCIPDEYNPFRIALPVPELKEDKPFVLDEIDYSLLEYLGNSPLDPFLEISNSLKMSRITVKQRITCMLDANVIQKFRYGINVFRLGFLLYVIKIEATPAAKKKLLPQLRADNYSGFIFETHTGFIMYYMPPSHNELFLFTRKIRDIAQNANVEVIQNTEFFQVNTVPNKALAIMHERAITMRK